MILTDDKIAAIAKKIGEHKGWDEKAFADTVFAELIRETVVMTVRTIEMCGLVIVERDVPSEEEDAA